MPWSRRGADRAMTHGPPSTQPVPRESRRSALLGLALTAPWLTASDLRGSVRPTGWVLLGMLLTDVYLFAVLAAPPGYIAPIPLYLPPAVILATLLLTPPRHSALPLL